MTGPIEFLKQTRDELKKVIWPTRTEVVRLTVTVIIISVVVGLFLGAFDYLFTSIITTFIK